MKKGIKILPKRPFLYLNDKYIISFSQTPNAFSGKINSQNVGRENFVAFINTLFAAGVFDTYKHLNAEGKPVYVDKLNPGPNGTGVLYEISHRYCGNECVTEIYELRVELNNNHEFIGYIVGEK